MDRIARAFRKANRNPGVRRKIVRYGVARFQHRSRRHLQAGEPTIVRIYDEEPENIRGSMISTLEAWKFDGHKLQHGAQLTYAEARQLWSEGFQGQPLRPNPGHGTIDS